MEFFFGLPILLNIKRGFGALDVFHGTYHPVGVECFQTICAGKRGLADKLVDKPCKLLDISVGLVLPCCILL